MTRSIAELLASGITVKAEEAVAIAQQLIRSVRDRHDTDEARPPYGPPSAENVLLTDEGAVYCRACQTRPAVSEIGIFLESLLSPGSPRVPGGLRYTIARALLNVDVPPFDSLCDLSRDLERHEHGRRADLVRAVLARADGEQPAAALTLVQRRNGRASASELRRALRDADARWFEHQRPLPRDPLIDLLPPAQPAPPCDAAQGRPLDLVRGRRDRDRTLPGAAVCLAAGLALIGAGELMHRRHAQIQTAPSAQTAPVVEDLPAANVARVEPAFAVLESPGRGVIAVRDVPSSRARPAVRRVSLKRTPARPAAGAVRRQRGSRPFDGAQARTQSRGVLDRLKLGWLRRAFTVHSEL